MHVATNLALPQSRLSLEKSPGGTGHRSPPFQRWVHACAAPTGLGPDSPDPTVETVGYDLSSLTGLAERSRVKLYSATKVGFG
jgi:hypothetical protein